jgi:hypothetical protein
MWVVLSRQATSKVQHDIAGAIALAPFVGHRRALDTAAQPVELTAPM